MDYMEDDIRKLPWSLGRSRGWGVRERKLDLGHMS